MKRGPALSFLAHILGIQVVVVAKTVFRLLEGIPPVGWFDGVAGRSFDGLVRQSKRLARSPNRGVWRNFKTDWFTMPHNVWAYDCKLTFNISYSHEDFYRIRARGNLRAQVDGSHVTDNEVRPFLREIVKGMVTGGWLEP